MKGFIIISAICFISCGPDFQEDVFQGDAPLSPPYFSNGFQEGFKFQEGGVEYSFSTLNCGELDLGSGYLVIDQPLVFYDQKAIPQKLPQGQFRVELSQALLSRDGVLFDKRNAMARIKFRKKAAVAWRAISVFHAQGGVSGFVDYQLLKSVIQKKQIQSLSKEVQSANREANTFLEPFENHHAKLTRYVEMEVLGATFFGFQTGWGETTVVSYLGFDENGEMVEILCDFNLFPYEQFEKE